MSGRLSAFNSPFLLGFDHIEQTLDRLAKASGDSYPPYNLEQVGENQLRIVIAVAGFTHDDLSIQLQDNQLMIRGRQQPKEVADHHVFLHRGIASRQFQRSFLLAEGLEVKGASLSHGLLQIDLEQPPPNVQVKTIEIRSAGNDDAEDRPVTIEDNVAIEDK